MAPSHKADPVILHLSLLGSPVWLSKPGPVDLVLLYSSNGLYVQLPITLLAVVSPVLRQLLASNSCHQDEAVILLPAVGRTTLQALVTLLDTGVARVTGKGKILSSLGDLMEMLGIVGLFNITDIHVDEGDKDTTKLNDKDQGEATPEKVVKRCSLEWMLNSEVHLEVKNMEEETDERNCKMVGPKIFDENIVYILKEVDDLVYEEGNVHHIQSSEEFIVEDEIGVSFAEVSPVVKDSLKKQCDRLYTSLVENVDKHATTNDTDDDVASVDEPELWTISSPEACEEGPTQYQLVPPLGQCGGRQYPSSLISNNPRHNYSLNKVYPGSKAATTLYYCCVKKGSLGCKGKCKVRLGRGNKLELVQSSFMEHNHPEESN